MPCYGYDGTDWKRRRRREIHAKLMKLGLNPCGTKYNKLFERLWRRP